ncbi:hypothetical protein GCM10027443_25320 [Pontibacter brevis]
MEIYKDYMFYLPEAELKLLRSGWLRKVDSAMYREGMLHVREIIEHQQLKFWLYDASKFTAPDISDQIWTVEVLGALLAETTLLKIAVVVPKDVFLQTVAEQVRFQARPVFEGSIKMENFFDVGSAEEWLLA